MLQNQSGHTNCYGLFFFGPVCCFSVSGYAGYFPVHPSTRLHAWRLTQKQQEEANKNNEEDLTASEAT